MALGFKRESIQLITVPQHYQMQGGNLEAVMAENTGEPIAWGTTLQRVHYGNAGRKKAIDDAFLNIEGRDKLSQGGSFEQKTTNSIFLIPVLLSIFALVKHKAFKDEREWRLTTAEHFGPFSPSQVSALSESGFLFLSGVPSITIDVKFREGGPGAFRPYTEIKFPKSALVNVVLGPTVDPVLGVSTVRRVLDRYGFQNTQIGTSKLPYRP
jgi:hypothetical protein